MTPPAGDTCQVCGDSLPDSTETGRPRKFCSDRCRSRAHRVRKHETERAAARLARRCDVEVAGHRCDRAAAFLLAVDGRELKVCPACRELALAFLVGQGASATAVEVRPIANGNTEPTRTAPRPSDRGKVLLIEDDKNVVFALSPSLEARGYEVVSAFDGITGLREAMTQRPDVVLLDLGLPDIDGITLLRKLRSASDVPVIVVTARGRVEDRTLGLLTGADDYLVKPFDIGELVARMRGVMRRSITPPEQVYDDGVLRVDFTLQEVRVGGNEVPFTRLKFRLIEILVRSAGIIQPIDAIVAHVWAESEVTGFRKQNLAVLVAVVRRTLRAEGLDPNSIVTAHGLGYYYQPPNRPARPASGPRIGYSHAERLLNLPDKQTPAARAPGHRDVHDDGDQPPQAT
ncbi:response regulator transcription factor [Umezawaea endophytica]|uniref:Response regulator transcription factor n=1 Tax=Umezawaea endophytica TaxID=1654476 RepID=A0A9X2VX99_9PSEU|nr:response regulator transcription factor [Umezawaea endophytica]MCS7484600.1 response regulator transcription factor [Umezawaea endophytica]